MTGPPGAPAERAARQASTVLLVRDHASARGVEVFMERRHIESDFVGGAYVFPGGAVDPEDRIPEGLCRGLDDAAASARLGLDHGGLAFWVAAIRECFEEAGVLLAYGAGGELLDFADPAVEDRYRALRDELNAGKLTLIDLARSERLELATDRIHYWGHWITPEGQPRRYDTRFFVAHAPENQTAAHDDWELVHSAWVTPAEAIERAVRREWMIIFPTLMNLKQLGEFARAEDALAWAVATPPLVAMVPRVLGDRIVLPGDEGYEDAERDTSKSSPEVWFRQFQRVLGEASPPSSSPSSPPGERG
ncbi:MAG TPA: NUDIX hydrolase [Thermoanaerobaculia bacterium]|nr:NUDIX hydrolase [Thermoanaerobaculia bacterium]